MVKSRMDIVVTPDHILRFGTERFECALGKGGIRMDKREGDGATPTGTFRLRRLYYRPDKGSLPETQLPSRAIGATDGWCDAPDHPLYNRLVTLPFDASHERMWRDDGLYDVVVEIGHNDAPARNGLGSAVFIHVATAGYGPTEGCIALAKPDLLRLLPRWTNNTKIEILADAAD